MSNKSRPRVAVIGYGRWGRAAHCALVQMASKLELHGVASSDAQKRAQIEAELGCRAYASFDEVVADETVDVVVLATPTHTHAPLAIAALDAGKNVVTDKAMCLSLAQCDAMIEAARANHRLLTVFQNRRRDGDFMTVQQLMQNGELGEVNWIEMAWQGLGAWGSWRGESTKGGGRFYDLGAHLIDQLLLLFPDEIESVYCRMHHDFPDKDVESEALIIVNFAGGRTGVCDLSSRCAIAKPRFLVHGSAATFCKYGLDPQENALKAGDIDAAEETPENYGLLKSADSERHVPTVAGRWRDFYENLGEVLTDGAKPMVSLSDARRTMSVIDAALQSARCGEVVGFGQNGAR